AGNAQNPAPPDSPSHSLTVVAHPEAAPKRYANAARRQAPHLRWRRGRGLPTAPQSFTTAAAENNKEAVQAGLVVRRLLHPPQSGTLAETPAVEESEHSDTADPDFCVHEPRAVRAARVGRGAASARGRRAREAEVPMGSTRWDSRRRILGMASCMA